MLITRALNGNGDRQSPLIVRVMIVSVAVLSYTPRSNFAAVDVLVLVLGVDRG